MLLKEVNPPHPGSVIKEAYIEPFNLGINEVARLLKVSPSTFSRVLNGQSDISPTMALKLSKVLGRSPESWLLMQSNFDLAMAKNQIVLDDYKRVIFKQNTVQART